VVEEPESSLSLLGTGVGGKSTLLELNKKQICFQNKRARILTCVY
jgi:hypothetical protein